MIPINKKHFLILICSVYSKDASFGSVNIFASIACTFLTTLILKLNKMIFERENLNRLLENKISINCLSKSCYAIILFIFI